MSQEPVTIDEETLQEIIRLRDELMEKSPMPPYYPRGAITFIKIPLEPGDGTSPFGGYYFSSTPSAAEADEIEKLYRDRGLPIPPRSQAIIDHARGICPHCGCKH